MERSRIEDVVNTLQTRAINGSALNNKAYQLWQETTLSTEAAEIFLANYFARTINTVARVCDVMTTLLKNPLTIIKNPLYAQEVANNVKNLQDEIGDGEGNLAHPILMTNWMNTLLNKMGSQNTPIEDNYLKFVTQETIDFSRVQKELYASSSLHTVVGVSLAQEILANHMMKQLFNGYENNYDHLFESKAEFEATHPYFLVHILGAEENHARLAANLVFSICENEEQIEEINNSYDQFEEVTINFWNGISNSIEALGNSSSSFEAYELA